jgi:hypothetical protein
MTKYILNILLVIFFSEGSLQAQIYVSKKLAEIGEHFPKKWLPENDSIFDCPQIIQKKSFIISYNNTHEIKHLGISLFSPETKEIINLPVCNFIERMMLELVLQQSGKDIEARLQQSRISLRLNGVEFNRGYFTSLNSTLDDMQNPAQFSIRKDSCYTVYWKYSNDDILSMSFPVSRELIFGTDKKESDQITGELFTETGCDIDTEKNPGTIASDLQLQNNSDLFVKKGSTFLSNKINSDTYYQRSDSKYQLVFNSEYPTESLANLLTTRQDKSLVLKINHCMYGGFTPEFSIPLSRFLCLFNTGFSTYCILKRLDLGQVQVSAVIHNNDFGYIHLLRIKTTSRELFMDNGTLTADLYTNIPEHNLKNLLTTY